MSEEMKSESLQINALTNIGVLYMQQRNYTRSLEYLSKAKKKMEEAGDEMQLGPVLGNIGIVLEHTGNHAIALEYFSKALKIAEGADDKDRIGIWLENMGVSYDEQGDSLFEKGEAFAD